MNKEYLQYLVDELRKWPGEKFNFGSWAEGFKLGEEINLSHCGATCCALGLAASLPLFKQIGMRLEQVPGHALLSYIRVEGRPVQYGTSASSQDIINDFATSIESAMFIFDLTHKEAKYLFIPETELLSTNLPMGPNESASPEQVADHIERFIQEYVRLECED